MGPRTLRATSRKASSELPETARANFLTAAAQLVSTSLPQLSTHLGQQALLYVDAQQVLLSSVTARSQLCRKCGSPLNPQTCSDVHIAWLSEASSWRLSKKLTGSAAAGRTRGSSKEKLINRVVAVRTCMACQEKSVRPFLSANLAAQQLSREGFADVPVVGLDLEQQTAARKAKRQQERQQQQQEQQQQQDVAVQQPSEHNQQQQQEDVAMQQPQEHDQQQEPQQAGPSPMEEVLHGRQQQMHNVSLQSKRPLQATVEAAGAVLLPPAKRAAVEPQQQQQTPDAAAVDTIAASPQPQLHSVTQATGESLLDATAVQQEQGPSAESILEPAAATQHMSTHASPAAEQQVFGFTQPAEAAAEPRQAEQLPPEQQQQPGEAEDQGKQQHGDTATPQNGAAAGQQQPQQHGNVGDDLQQCTAVLVTGTEPLASPKQPAPSSTAGSLEQQQVEVVSNPGLRVEPLPAAAAAAAPGSGAQEGGTLLPADEAPAGLPGGSADLAKGAVLGWEAELQQPTGVSQQTASTAYEEAAAAAAGPTQQPDALAHPSAVDTQQQQQPGHNAGVDAVLAGCGRAEDADTAATDAATFATAAAAAGLAVTANASTAHNTAAEVGAAAEIALLPAELSGLAGQHLEHPAADAAASGAAAAGAVATQRAVSTSPRAVQVTHITGRSSRTTAAGLRASGPRQWPLCPTAQGSMTWPLAPTATALQLPPVQQQQQLVVITDESMYDTAADGADGAAVGNDAAAGGLNSASLPQAATGPSTQQASDTAGDAAAGMGPGMLQQPDSTACRALSSAAAVTPPSRDTQELPQEQQDNEPEAAAASTAPQHTPFGMSAAAEAAAAVGPQAAPAGTAVVTTSVGSRKAGTSAQGQVAATADTMSAQAAAAAAALAGDAAAAPAVVIVDDGAVLAAVSGSSNAAEDQAASASTAGDSSPATSGPDSPATEDGVAGAAAAAAAAGSPVLPYHGPWAGGVTPARAVSWDTDSQSWGGSMSVSSVGGEESLSTTQEQEEDEGDVDMHEQQQSGGGEAGGSSSSGSSGSEEDEDSDGEEMELDQPPAAATSEATAGRRQQQGQKEKGAKKRKQAAFRASAVQQHLLHKAVGRKVLRHYVYRM